MFPQNINIVSNSVPKELSIGHCTDYIKSLPVVTLPEGLGLNENAAISKNMKDSQRLLAGVLKTQPQQSEGSPTEGAAAIASGPNNQKILLTQVKK